MKLPATRKPRVFDAWDPYREIAELQDRLANLMPAYTAGNGTTEAPPEADWMPVVDISEDDGAYLIEAELPDVKKEDVSVSLEHGTLTISGERHQETEEKKKKYHRVERSWGRYQRSFHLPEGVDADQVNAQFKNGVLRIRVPKTEQHQKLSRTIPVED